MIQPSQFLRRALLADAIFSGVSAVGLTVGADGFAALFSLPEALLRETGLFLWSPTPRWSAGSARARPCRRRWWCWSWSAMRPGRSPALHCCSRAR